MIQQSAKLGSLMNIFGSHRCCFWHLKCRSPFQAELQRFLTQIYSLVWDGLYNFSFLASRTGSSLRSCSRKNIVEVVPLTEKVFERRGEGSSSPGRDLVPALKLYVTWACEPHASDICVRYSMLQLANIVFLIIIAAPVTEQDHQNGDAGHTFAIISFCDT